MTKRILIASLVIILSSCCTQKKCIGNALPIINIQFSGIENETGNQLVLYTYVDGVISDSSTWDLTKSYPELQIAPFEKYEKVNKKFILKWNNKTETLSDLDCDFREEKIKCNTCFLFVPEKETVTGYTNFIYTSSTKGKITKDQTLQLNW